MWPWLFAIRCTPSLLAAARSISAVAAPMPGSRTRVSGDRHSHTRYAFVCHGPKLPVSMRGRCAAGPALRWMIGSLTPSLLVHAGRSDHPGQALRHPQPQMRRKLFRQGIFYVPHLEPVTDLALEARHLLVRDAARHHLGEPTQ